jgi:hypothetical protein
MRWLLIALVIGASLVGLMAFEPVATSLIIGGGIYAASVYFRKGK